MHRLSEDEKCARLEKKLRLISTTWNLNNNAKIRLLYYLTYSVAIYMTFGVIFQDVILNHGSNDYEYNQRLSLPVHVARIRLIGIIMITVPRHCCCHGNERNPTLCCVLVHCVPGRCEHC